MSSVVRVIVERMFCIPCFDFGYPVFSGVHVFVPVVFIHFTEDLVKYNLTVTNDRNVYLNVLADA